MITVVGLMGTAPPAELLASAALLVGGRDQLAAHAPPGARTIALTGDLTAAVDALRDAEDAVVLASGDPGFFGIVRRLAAELGPERLDVRPAPSSVATAFARLGLPWDDAIVVSAHARGPHVALNAARRHPKVAILTGPGDASAPALAARLPGRRLVLAERLGTPEERVLEGVPADARDPNVLLALAPGASDRATLWPPRPGPPGWALPEDAFAHRAGLITKAEVRALALARLGPGAGDLVWDVGCGSGSIAVEAARLGAAAIAIDDDPGAIALTAENAARHAVPVETVHGRAPQALLDLPDPDAVFVGGGGADLDAILDLVATRARRTVVVTLALVDRVTPALDRLTAAGLVVEGVQLSASRLRPIAGGHRLAAENPVTVLTGTRG